MEVIDADKPAKVNADLYIAEASDFVHHARSSNQSSRVGSQQQRTILVGRTSQLAQVGYESSKNVVKLGHPLGPRALVRALYAALERPKFVDHPIASSGITNIIMDYHDIGHVDPPSIGLTYRQRSNQPYRYHGTTSPPRRRQRHKPQTSFDLCRLIRCLTSILAGKEYYRVLWIGLPRLSDCFFCCVVSEGF
jgi:hypothetical protein